MLSNLDKLKQKELDEAEFKAVELDEREDELKDINLHEGFETGCGIKGGKLSGG